MLVVQYTAVNDFTVIKTMNSIGQVKDEFPGISFTDPVTSEQFSARGLPADLVAEIAKPALEYGETATFLPVRQLDTTWLQVWTVSIITLAQAKADLAVQAIGVYWSKIDAVPDTAELTTAAGSYATVKVDRETRFLPKLNQVRQDILALTDPPDTVADAKAIYDTLVDAA